MALVGDISSNNRSGGALSIITMSFGLGIAVGPSLSGILVTYGLAIPFLIGASLASSGAVLVIIHVDESSKDRSGSALIHHMEGVNGSESTGGCC